MAANFDARRSATLAWVLRLPFVSAPQMALLLGDPEPTVNASLRGLERAGWLDWVDSTAPDAEAGRLYLLTDEARKWLTERLAAAPDAVTLSLPLARNETLHRLAGIEATIAFNRFVAEMAAASHCELDLDLSEAVTLPVRRREAWWPPGVHGILALQHKERIAPLFVAIDHPSAPAMHRASMVSAWYSHRDVRQPSAAGTTILVLATDSRRAEEWSQVVARSAERRGVLPLDVLVTASETGSFSALRAQAWRSANSQAPVSLLRGLNWRSHSSRCDSITSLFDAAPETLPRSRRLHQWARQILGEAPTRARHVQRERVVALSLVTSPEQVGLLETVGRLPLLTESYLAVVLAAPSPLLRRQLERATQHGLIEAVTRPDGSKYFVLSEYGLRLLATRAGVPFRRFAEHTPFVASLPGAAGGRLQTLVRQFDHTIGANSFMLSYIRHSMGAATPRLASWRNAHEAAVRFESSGVRRTLRPDAAGELAFDGESNPFFLEWDRGTERINILLEKLARYAAYFHSNSGSVGTLLFITPTPHREDLVWQAISVVLKAEPGCGRVVTTVASLVTPRGPFAPIWRSRTSVGRIVWLG